MASFFDLPPETRNTIYGSLLTDSSPNLTKLTASRLLHEEAASFFYQNTDIDIGLLDAATTDATTLPPVPDKYLRYVRVLTVNVRLLGRHQDQEQADRLASIAEHCSRLTTVILNITSSASNVVSRTLDEYVLHASHPLTLALRHLLSRGSVRSIRINLDNVWIAPGVSHHLMSDGRLELCQFGPSIERPVHGQGTRTYLRELGLGLQDVEDVENAQSEGYGGAFPSMPSSLNTALSEMDFYSPTKDLDDVEDLRDCAPFRSAGGTTTTTARVSHIAIPHSVATADDEHSMLSREEMMFDMDDLNGGSEEELTDDDDVDDEDMEEIDDIEGIVDRLVQAHQQQVTDEDVCYMTNFAPNMLRAWCESLH